MGEVKTRRVLGTYPGVLQEGLQEGKEEWRNHQTLAIPPTPGKEGSGSKNPHFSSPSHDLEKGVFCQTIPIFPVFPCRKKGIFDRKLPFPGQGKRRFLDPETLFSRKWGFGTLSGIGGNLNQTPHFSCNIAPTCVAVCPPTCIARHLQITHGVGVTRNFKRCFKGVPFVGLQVLREKD